MNPRDTAPAPLLRGWLHVVCFFVSLPAGGIVVWSAATARGRVGAFVYAAGLSALFGVSGLYHRRRWQQPLRARLKRLDHATIFVMIAGTYTPLCLVALKGLGTWLLVGVWAVALGGVVLSVVGVAERKVVGLVSYIALGWAAVIALPGFARNLTDTEMLLIVAGGIIYTVGAVILGTRWPDPFPRVFGYHEVWHALVVGAVVCHFLVILSVVQAPA